MPNGTSERPILADSFWQAPLVPAAVSCTAGIVYDRFYGPPLRASLTLAAVCLVAWLLVFLTDRRPRKAVCYLVLLFAPLGAAYHHFRRDVWPADTLGALLGEKPVPVQLRGFLDEEPSALAREEKQPLRSRAQGEGWSTVLQTHQCKQDGIWLTCPDRVAVYVEGGVADLHVGDEVEILGQASRIPGIKNPGEVDLQGFNRDQGIYTRVAVRGEPQGVIRLESRWWESYRGWLAAIRGWGEQAITEAIPDRLLGGLAQALVLGDGAALTQKEWGRYQRTGVIHVLVISGQHLVLLAAIFLWILPRLGFRLASTGWIVGLLLIFYILLTGGRPPGMRSAVGMSAFFIGWMLRRRIVPANILALAWLFVAALNPMDLFSPGCQLSFLSVLILYRIGLLWDQQERFAPDRQDPKALDRLLWKLRPYWLRWFFDQWGAIKDCYKITFLVWLGITPLVAWHYHTVPFVAPLLGPPVALLTTVALLAGFLLLALSALHLPGIGLCALTCHYSLAACDCLVDWADRLWWSHTYIPDLPAWWFVGFYAGILALLTLRCGVFG